MHDVAVSLDLHELVNRHTSCLRNAANVIPTEVNEHDMFAPFLLVRQEVSLKGRVLCGSRATLARPGERPVRDYSPTIDTAEDLWRRGHENAPARLHARQLLAFT
jgi:hypothetical protein